MAVAVVVLGVLNGQLHVSIWLSVLAALGCGVVIGAVNATLTVVLGVPSIVVTLGTGTLLAALATAIRDVVVTDISPGLVTVISGKFLGLTNAAYFAVALTFVTWYVLTFTPLGRYMFFVGANQNVAKLSGLPVNAIRFGALVATSTFAALAGVLLVGSLGSAGPQFASPFLLPAFAAAFLGSTTIRPGRFNAWGAFVAVYFLTTGITGLEVMGLSGWVEGAFYGGSLVVASSLSYLSKARAKRATAPST
jgi:ribose transport system permease protein